MIIISGGIFLSYGLFMLLHVIYYNSQILHLTWAASLSACLFVYLYWIRMMRGSDKNKKSTVAYGAFVVLNLLIFMFFIIFGLPGVEEGRVVMFLADAVGAIMVLFLLYLMWSASHCLVTREIGRSAKFHEAVGAFILLMLLPIGMFFLKGRIRKI